MSRDAESPRTSDVIGDVNVSNADGGVMTTHVLMSFDAELVDAGSELDYSTLLLHNDPVITPLTDVVKIYPNTSQIIQIQVGMPISFNLLNV